MPELQLLHADHAAAVLAFERTNRAYFAAAISDRGDEYFENFSERHETLLADQHGGNGAYYVAVSLDGPIMGRFNLIFAGDGTATLGYRVGEQFASQGLATTSVLEVCRLASSRHGLRAVAAAVSHQNLASQKVLLKSGFVPIRPAGPRDLGGGTGTWYQRDL